VNPNLAYQLYQAERTKTRAEILNDDARRGHLAATVTRPSRHLIGRLSRRARTTTQTIKDLGVAAGQSAH
jgi:hypothetical protein